MYPTIQRLPTTLRIQQEAIPGAYRHVKWCRVSELNTFLQLMKNVWLDSPLREWKCCHSAEGVPCQSQLRAFVPLKETCTYTVTSICKLLV